MPTIYRTSAFGHIDWQIPIEHFLWDRVIEAHEYAASLGVGTWGEYLPWYRMIEAEWLVRSRGEIRTVNDWLKVETLLEETGNTDTLGSEIESICEQTAQAFHVDERPEVLVSVLSMESDAPWVSARAGYFIDKFPYDKICIPHNALGNANHLREVVAHEYTHALNLTLAQAKCPLWLNEGMAMIAQANLNPEVKRAFVSGAAEWKTARDLDAAFHAEVHGGRDETTVLRAYEQAAWVVRFLLTLGDQAKLGELMHAFNDNSLLEELKIKLTSETPADEALYQTYGIREDEAITQAFVHLGGSDPR